MESQTIGKLAEALSKAQGEMQNAAKDKDNPFFKSTYADLASVWDACRDPLSKNGLAVVQSLSVVEGKVYLTSKLVHSSGEWIDSQVPVQPVKNDPQGMGSAITYMRRFSLAAIVGIAPAEAPTQDDVADDDDDGNKASGRVVVTPKWNFGNKEKDNLRNIMNSVASGKQIVNDWKLKNGDINGITEEKYHALVVQLQAAKEFSEAPVAAE